MGRLKTMYEQASAAQQAKKKKNTKCIYFSYFSTDLSLKLAVPII